MSRSSSASAEVLAIHLPDLSALPLNLTAHVLDLNAHGIDARHRQPSPRLLVRWPEGVFAAPFEQDETAKCAVEFCQDS
jgi:hypothetical protein